MAETGVALFDTKPTREKEQEGARRERARAEYVTLKKMHIFSSNMQTKGNNEHVINIYFDRKKNEYVHKYIENSTSGNDTTNLIIGAII